MYTIQSNFLEYEHLGLSIRDKLSENSHKRKHVIGPDLLSTLSMLQCSNKGCSDICKRMTARNDNLLQNIQGQLVNKTEWRYIQFQYVKCIFGMSFIFILDTFSRLIHFKLVHNRVKTDTILLKMNLADSSRCLFCNGEAVVHAFLECENVTRFWRSIECWKEERLIDMHFKLLDVDYIFGTFPMNITISNVILKNRQIYVAPLHEYKWDASFIIRWLKRIYSLNFH